MKISDPALEATFEIRELPTGGFGVQVAIPDSSPTMVTSFATQADAETWIASYKARVEAGPPAKRWMRGPNRAKTT